MEGGVGRGHTVSASGAGRHRTPAIPVHFICRVWFHKRERNERGWECGVRADGERRKYDVD